MFKGTLLTVLKVNISHLVDISSQTAVVVAVRVVNVVFVVCSAEKDVYY